MKTKNELKPCPFCGSENVRLERRRDGATIGCLGYGISICAFVTDNELKEMWNRRDYIDPKYIPGAIEISKEAVERSSKDGKDMFAELIQSTINAAKLIGTKE